MPAHNAVGIFFGIGQTKLPEEYFSRFLLLLFIWFCLMFRTCYQSKNFEFITSDMRKPMPETFEDLAYWNYTIFAAKRFNEGLRRFEFADMQERIKAAKKEIMTFDGEELTKLYEQALNGSLKKCAFITNNFNHARLNATFNQSLAVMKHDQQARPISRRLRNIILCELFDQTLTDLIPYGIPRYLDELASWVVNRPYNVEIVSPQVVLTMEILEFGFVVWIAAVSVAFVVFLCEILIKWVTSFKKWATTKLVDAALMVEFVRNLENILETIQRNS